MSLKYNAAMVAAGDDVQKFANTMKIIGADMFQQLHQLAQEGKLTGDGIATELQRAHRRWDAECDEFANAENDFGVRTKDAFYNMMAEDRRGGGLFPI